MSEVHFHIKSFEKNGTLVLELIKWESAVDCACQPKILMKDSEHVEKNRVVTRDHIEFRRRNVNAVKENGKEFFKLKQFRKAINCYTMCLEHQEYRLENSEVHIYYTNRSLCHLQLGEFYEALEDADLALTFDNSFQKAHHIKVKALFGLERVLEARLWAEKYATHLLDSIYDGHEDGSRTLQEFNEAELQQQVIDVSKELHELETRLRDDRKQIIETFVAQLGQLPDYDSAIIAGWQQYVHCRDHPMVQRVFNNLIKQKCLVEHVICSMLTFPQDGSPNILFMYGMFLEFLSCFPASAPVFAERLSLVFKLHTLNRDIGDKNARYNRLYNIMSGVIFAIENSGDPQVWKQFQNHFAYFVNLFCSEDNDQEALQFLVDRLDTFVAKWKERNLHGEYVSVFWKNLQSKLEQKQCGLLLNPRQAVVACKSLFRIYPDVMRTITNTNEFQRTVIFASIFAYDFEKANIAETLLTSLSVPLLASDLSNWAPEFFEYFFPMSAVHGAEWPEQIHTSYSENLSVLQRYPCVGEDPLLGELDNGDVTPRHSMREICFQAVEQVLSTDFEINKDLLLRLHDIIEMRELYKGFKVQNVAQNCARARYIPALIDKLLSYISEMIDHKVHPLTIATFALFGIVSIHPFTDGNGRVSRLFANAILLKLGHPVIVHYDNKKYYDAFQMYNIKQVISYVQDCVSHIYTSNNVSTEYLVSKRLYQKAFEFELSNGTFESAMKIAREFKNSKSLPAACDDYRGSKDIDYHVAHGMESISNYLKRLKPSQIIGEKNWIFVSNQSFQRYTMGMIKVPHEMSKMLSGQIKYNKDRNTTVANALKWYIGKWVIKCNRKNVDESWVKIVKAVSSDQLSIQAKVSTVTQALLHDPQNADSFIICVYICDYENKNEIKDTREKLRELGWIEPLEFVRDIDTLARAVNGYMATPEEIYLRM
jgi:tetratricopeptide (TPR) repeat protein